MPIYISDAALLLATRSRLELIPTEGLMTDQPIAHAHVPESDYPRRAEGTSAAKLIAADAADRFRDVLSECLWLRGREPRR